MHTVTKLCILYVNIPWTLKISWAVLGLRCNHICGTFSLFITIFYQRLPPASLLISEISEPSPPSSNRRCQSASVFISSTHFPLLSPPKLLFSLGSNEISFRPKTNQPLGYKRINLGEKDLSNKLVQTKNKNSSSSEN